MYCLGCGSDIAGKPADRRALNVSGSAHVATVWKTFIKNVGQQDVEDIDNILSGGDSHRVPKMCRTCYSAYERYSKLYDTIQENLKKAADVLRIFPSSSVAQPVSKRPRLGSSFSQQVGHSPEVEVCVGYKTPKTFVLTPSRKHMAKAIARKSKKAVAAEALKDPVTKKYILKKLGNELAKEVRGMASDSTNSILQSQNPEHLKGFAWEMLLNELSKFAPVLKSLLSSATSTRVHHSSTDAVIGMCAAILIKHRNSRMNLVQKINSLILYAGHSSKQVYQRLQKVNLAVSHSSVIRLLEIVGKGFDAQVKEWRDHLLSTLDSSNEIKTQRAPWFASMDEDDSPSDDSSGDSDTFTDSDDSWKSYSPITSEDEDDDDFNGSSSPRDDESEVDSSDDEENPTNPPTQPPTSGSQQQGSTFDPPQTGCTADRPHSHHSHIEQQDHPTMYHLVGDNLDKGRKQRYMRIGTSKPDYIHCFHSYAVADRIDFSNLSELVIPTQQRDAEQVAVSLLPTPEDDLALRDNMCVLISRILYQNLEFFRLSFDGVLAWHIKHDFYDEMSTKSKVNPLGILPRDENKTEHMVDIMDVLQQYVPMVEMVKDYHVPSIGRTVQVVTALTHPIQFAGDQKTAVRARGAQKAKVNEVSPSRRLAGLVPVVADWHTKVILLNIIWKFFYSHSSVGDHGTLYQLRNKLNRTNVVRTPKNDVNACEDFIEIITAGLVVAAALATLELQSVSDTPAEAVLPRAEDVWTLPESERREWLMKLCRRVFDKFVNFSYNTGVGVPTGGDGVCEYSVQLLRLGCFYMEFADAIREGDGGRVLRCWKYMLPMFLASGNRNYACEAANFLLQHSYTLSPRLSAQLLWSRFVNVRGQPGKNIPVDLHMEHLNRIAKGAIGFQGSNQSVKALQRIGRAIGALAPVMDNFDSNNQVTSTSSRQRKPTAQKDIQVVVNELVKYRCFFEEKGRKHRRFPHPKDVLSAKDKKEVVDWLINKLPRAF